MFEIDYGENQVVNMIGRLDASQSEKAQNFLDTITGGCVLSLEQLEYISSAGLGVLLKTHKRLMSGGDGLKLVQVNKHICDIFLFSGFDKLFQIEPLDK